MQYDGCWMSDVNYRQEVRIKRQETRNKNHEETIKVQAFTLCPQKSQPKSSMIEDHNRPINLKPITLCVSVVKKYQVSSIKYQEAREKRQEARRRNIQV